MITWNIVCVKKVKHKKYGSVFYSFYFDFLNVELEKIVVPCYIQPITFNCLKFKFENNSNSCRIKHLRNNIYIPFLSEKSRVVF